MYSLFTNRENEFSKLSKEEQLACLEVLEENPKGIRLLVQSFASTNDNRVIIDAGKLLVELVEFYKQVTNLEGNEGN